MMNSLRLLTLLALLALPLSASAQRVVPESRPTAEQVAERVEGEEEEDSDQRAESADEEEDDDEDWDEVEGYSPEDRTRLERLYAD